MGKHTKRPGREARDVHAVIRVQAAALKRFPPGQYLIPADMPELNALVLTAVQTFDAAARAAVPSVAVFEGRTYWLRVAMLAKVEVFDSPGAADPVAPAALHRIDGAGHEPGH